MNPLAIPSWRWYASRMNLLDLEEFVLWSHALWLRETVSAERSPNHYLSWHSILSSLSLNLPQSTPSFRVASSCASLHIESSINPHCQKQISIWRITSTVKRESAKKVRTSVTLKLRWLVPLGLSTQISSEPARALRLLVPWVEVLWVKVHESPWYVRISLNPLLGFFTKVEIAHYQVIVARAQFDDTACFWQTGEKAQCVASCRVLSIVRKAS